MTTTSTSDSNDEMNLPVISSYFVIWLLIDIYFCADTIFKNYRLEIKDLIENIY